MKTSKCLMGVMLSAVLLVGSVFAGNPLSQDVKDGILKKGQISVYNEIRTVGEFNGNTNRDCTDCEFDFTPYGSECCDSAWDEFGIDCMTLEANYNWDCSGCLCPGDGEAVCGDGFCSGDETYETCPSDCNAPGECDAGQVLDCDGSDECWPESWIGDGFADCQDQAYGADLTCYDCDGGDCPESDPGCGGTAECGDGYCNGDETEASCPEDCSGGTTGGTESCDDCEFDWTPYGSECCDTAWDEYGINCADLEANYNWDCAGCNCPGDGDPVCGDGSCNGDETYETCPEDCNAPGECDEGYVSDCVDDDCCPESWIGDGLCDGEDQAWGCDLICYDNDGGDCVDPFCGDGVCNGDETYDTCPSDCNAPGECDEGYVSDCVDDDCCPETWIGDGLCDGEDQEWGCDLTCYDWDGGDCAEPCENYTCWDGSCVDDMADCPDEPVVPEPTGVCIAGENYAGYPAVTVSWDIETACGDGLCNGDEDYYNCPDDCNAPGECDDGYVPDCADDDCCPESWIGDGFEDCEDQAWGCDLTCYDNDGGDCGGTDGGTDGGTESCDDCEFDFTPYGSECCDTAWDEFGIDCMTLEANYNWDCSGCNCPGDGEAVCGDGFCSGDETYDNCPDDCLPPGECPDGQIVDCDGTNECWPESWIGDGFADCNDQQYGADLTCYDCDGGDCPDSDPGCSSCADQGLVDCPDGSCAASTDDCPEQECPAGTIADCSGDGDCGFETWLGDGYCDGSSQQYGIDNCCYDNDGGDCTDEECAGGRAQVASEFKKGYELTALHNGRLVDVIKAEKQSAISLRDGVVVHGSGEAVRMNEVIDNPSRALTATVALSCDACLSGGPWSGEWIVAAMDFGYFTVYGFDAGSLVCGTVTFCEDTNGACSDTSGEVCAVAGDTGTSECVDEGPDCPSEAGSGDVNGDGEANVLDIVTIVNVILGGEFADECAAAAADVNGDGEANVLDIVQIVNGILGGRVDVGDATSGKLIKSNGALTLEANGYIGGVQMTLVHGADFSIDLNDNAMVAEYKTVGNTTKLVIVAPGSDELFTFSGDFEIEDMIVANSQGRVNVGAPVEFSLSTAYPNPFNPTTSLTLSVPEAGLVSVQVYNLMGQVVATLASGYMEANPSYQLTWDASNAASGMYLVKAEAAGKVTSQKLMLMK